MPFARSLLLIGVLGGLLLGTQGGLRLLVGLAGELAPDVLTIARIEGRLLGPLSLEGLTLRLPDLRLEIGALTLDWSPLDLRDGALRVARLAAREVRLTLLDTPPDPEPLRLPALVLPLGLIVEEARVDGLRIQRADAPDPLIVLERARLAASLRDGVLALSGGEAVLSRPGLPPLALTLGARGPAAALRVELALETPGGRIQGQGILGWSPRLTWDARLNFAGLDPGALLPGWSGRLDGRLLIQGALDETGPTGPRLLARLENLEGRVRDASVAASAEVTLADGAWRGQLDVSRLDLALLAPFLPAGSQTEGAARITGRLETRERVATGRAELTIARGRFDLPVGARERALLDVSGTRLTLDAGAPGLNARFALPFVGLGDLSGELRLPGWTPAAAPAQQALTGTLRARLDDFARLALFLPADIADLRGKFAAAVELGGTLGAPRARGEARLEDAGLRVPLFDLRVSGLNLTASAPTWENQVELRGGAIVGGGRVELRGEGRLGPTGPTARVTLDGGRLKLADTREYYLILSPSLVLEATPQAARIGGTLRIPEARIRPRALPPGTVTPSPDVEILGETPRAPYPLSLDVRLILGEQVTIDAFGVRGRLAGDLAVRREPGRDPIGDGQLQIVDGQYRLTSVLGIASDLGPPLRIIQGRLVYARSPLDNPGLLIQAERGQSLGTSAGVRVHGTLRDPRLAFFSETDPNLSQSEITKYLLTGIAPGGADQVEGGLAVGTYVTPKLYLEYENGLGSEPNSVRLRYDLTHRVEIETATGASQSGGIYFTFER